MAWLAVMGVVRCGDNGHYEVFFLYILDERLCFTYDLFMDERLCFTYDLFMDEKKQPKSC